MFILERTMKSILTSAILLSVFPLVGAQVGQRVHAVAADVPTTVLPISVGDGSEVRGPMRLRDALRQPFDDMDDTSKPYRLSAEERQRLREQLREQPPYDARLKP
jgi:predicted nucleotidyltransferase